MFSKIVSCLVFAFLISITYLLSEHAASAIPTQLALSGLSNSATYSSNSGCIPTFMSTFKDNLNNPEGTAFDSLGNIYVVDSDSIEKFDQAGNFLMKFGTAGNYLGQFESPEGLSIDSNGNLYVVDTYNNRVQRLDNLTGNAVIQFGSLGNRSGQFNFPEGIAIDKSGNIFVVDSDNSRVEKFDPSGKFLLQFGSFGIGDGQFNGRARGITVDSNGNIYVVDRFSDRVEKFDQSGNFLMKFGSFGFGLGQFSDPKGIVLDKSENIYVTDSGTSRVEKFDPSGKFLLVFSTKISYLPLTSTDPSSIAIDKSGNLYVTDDYNQDVEKFSLLCGSPFSFSPIKQTESGIPIENVVCIAGFTLLIKVEDRSPACVKPQTAHELVDRGWGMTYVSILTHTSPVIAELLNSTRNQTIH